MDTKVLLASYGGGHVNIIAKLYNLMLSSNIGLNVVGFTTAEIVLNKENIPFQSYQHFLHLYENPEYIKSLGEKLLKELGDNSLISRDESIAYLGINYFELENKYGADKAQEIYTKNGRFIFYPIDFAKRVLNYLKPDAYISTNSPRSEAAFFDAARELGIKTYCINDFYDPNEIRERTGNSDYANKLFVCTDAIKNIFVDKGWKSDDVIASGNPAFDDINSDKVRTEHKKIMDNYPILREKPSVLFIMAMGDVYKAYDKEILAALNELAQENDFNLIIRQHPNDSEVFDQNNYIISKKSESVHAWLHSSDLVVTVLSTVGLEASIIDIPVVQFLPADAPIDLSFSKLGIGINTEKIEVFKDEFLKALSLVDKTIEKEQLDKKDATTIISEYIINDLTQESR